MSRKLSQRMGRSLACLGRFIFIQMYQSLWWRSRKRISGIMRGGEEEEWLREYFFEDGVYQGCTEVIPKEEVSEIWSDLWE